VLASRDRETQARVRQRDVPAVNFSYRALDHHRVTGHGYFQARTLRDPAYLCRLFGFPNNLAISVDTMEKCAIMRRPRNQSAPLRSGAQAEVMLFPAATGSAGKGDHNGR